MKHLRPLSRTLDGVGHAAFDQGFVLRVITHRCHTSNAALMPAIPVPRPSHDSAFTFATFERDFVLRINAPYSMGARCVVVMPVMIVRAWPPRQFHKNRNSLQT